MKFLLDACCFCVDLHHAYILIIYIDLVRFFWMCIYVFLFFFSKGATDIDCLFHSFNMVTNSYQTFEALRCLNFTFYEINYKAHLSYFISKLTFIISTLLRIIINNRFNCFISKNISHCFLRTEQDPTAYLDTVWIIFDCYFLIIIYSFLFRLKQGKYGPLGGRPLFESRNSNLIGHFFNAELGLQNQSELQISHSNNGNELSFEISHTFWNEDYSIEPQSILSGIILEVYGSQIIEIEKVRSIEKGIILKENNSNGKNRRYFSMFPYPLIQQKKVGIEFQDLTGF